MTRKLYLITVTIMMLANAFMTMFITLRFGWEHRGQCFMAVLISTAVIIFVWYKIVKQYDRGPLQ